MKKFFLVMIIAFYCISCENVCDTACENVCDATEKTYPNPDSSLKGTWIGASYGEYLSSISEFKWNNFYAYEFFEDNRFTYYSTRCKYGVQTDKYFFTYVWKIENNQSYCKLYNNQYSDWEEFKIEKIDDDTIIINNIELKRRK